jgi:hypothetical protein
MFFIDMIEGNERICFKLAVEIESIGGSEAVVNASYPGDLSKEYGNLSTIHPH